MTTTPTPRLLHVHFQEVCAFDDGVHLTMQESAVRVIPAAQAVATLRALADAYERAELERAASMSSTIDKVVERLEQEATAYDEQAPDYPAAGVLREAADLVRSTVKEAGPPLASEQ